MPLEGERLTYGWALAVCYDAGWRGKDLIDAVALMCAESARYERAYHQNLDELGNLTSTDWGLFQINDKWHPDFELPEGLNALYNVRYAHKMWKANGKNFNAWAAYVSGAYKQFLPPVIDAWEKKRWENKLVNVEKRWG